MRYRFHILECDSIHFPPWIQCAPIPALTEAMIIQVLNESELAFQLDGDWWKAGEFKSDKSALSPPKSETTVEISPSTVRS